MGKKMSDDIDNNWFNLLLFYLSKSPVCFPSFSIQFPIDLEVRYLFSRSSYLSACFQPFLLTHCSECMNLQWFWDFYSILAWPLVDLRLRSLLFLRCQPLLHSVFLPAPCLICLPGWQPPLFLTLSFYLNFGTFTLTFKWIFSFLLCVVFRFECFLAPGHYI